METRLCLSDDMAKPFMKLKIGDKVKLEVEAVLVGAELRPDYNGEPDEDDSGKKKQPPKKPYCEFVVASVNSEEPDAPDYKNMSKDDFEKKVAKNRGY